MKKLAIFLIMAVALLAAPTAPLNNANIQLNGVSQTGVLAGNTTGAATATQAQMSTAVDLFGSTRGGILYRGVAGWSLLAPGTSGYVLTSSGAGADPAWTAEGHTGTVTSFSAGTLSPLFTTNVATATTTPALTFSLSTQSANRVFAGPSTGADAAPTFRALVAADVPALTTGSFVLTGNGSGGFTNTDMTYSTPTLSVPDAFTVSSAGSIALTAGPSGTGAAIQLGSGASGVIAYQRSDDTRPNTWRIPTHAGGHFWGQANSNASFDGVEDDALYFGYNIATTGAKIDPTEASMSINLESNYRTGGSNYFELHLGAIASTDGTQTTRLLSFQSNRDAPQTLSAASFQISPNSSGFVNITRNDTTAQLFRFQGDGTSIFTGTLTVPTISSAAGAALNLATGTSGTALTFASATNLAQFTGPIACVANTGDFRLGGSTFMRAAFALGSNVLGYGYNSKNDGSGNLVHDSTGTLTAIKISPSALTIYSSVSAASGSTPAVAAIFGNPSAASWTTTGQRLAVSGGTFTNTTTGASGTAATAVFTSFARPTLDATNATVTTTDSATVYIANSPANGPNNTITNPWSLWVAAGKSRFDGSVQHTGTATDIFGATANATIGVSADTTAGILQIVTPTSGTATLTTANALSLTFSGGATAGITGGAGNMTITSGTGASRTMTLRSTTSGSTATNFLIGQADQSLTFPHYGSGAATFDSSGNITSVSDARFKDVSAARYTRGLAEILCLKPVLYHWNKLSGLNQNDVNAGFIAQDVLSVIPEAIGRNKDGYYTFADRPITAALVNAVKELDARTGGREPHPDWIARFIALAALGLAGAAYVRAGRTSK